MTIKVRVGSNNSAIKLFKILLGHIHKAAKTKKSEIPLSSASVCLFN